MNKLRGPLKTASLLLQKAVYKRLSEDTILQTMVSGVFDEVPEGTPLPLVHLGDETINPYDTKTNHGEDNTVMIHVFAPGPGKTLTKQILDVVLQSLTAEPLEIGPGFEFDGLERELIEVSPDEQAYHGVCRFRIYTRQL
jgi:hypothetical protein